ncbi:MAG: hypothetical protein IT365_12820 [Candidatus Hydrogenedentes bacterium]|nr:hypothetical protein [Candidatus Hydrogenedentota bacterium]
MLEEAEAYHHDALCCGAKPDRSTIDTAIQKYENVLREVDLAEPIRLEILWNIALLYMNTPGAPPGDYSHWKKASEYYELIVKESPTVDKRVIVAHAQLGDIYSRTGELTRAESNYLRLRSLPRELTDEQRSALDPELTEFASQAVNHLVAFYEEHGVMPSAQGMADEEVAAAFSKRSKARRDAQMNGAVTDFLEHLLNASRESTSGTSVPEDDGNRESQVAAVPPAMNTVSPDSADPPIPNTGFSDVPTRPGPTRAQKTVLLLGLALGAALILWRSRRVWRKK